MKTWLLIFINPLWIINLNKMSTLWRYIFKAKNKLMSDIVTQRLIIYWTQSFLNTRLPIDMIGISILGWSTPKYQISTANIVFIIFLMDYIF